MCAIWSVLIALFISAPTLRCQSFSTSDNLIILVTGFPNSTSMFGYSGKASLFRSTGTSASGAIQFSPVAGAQDVDCERNSAADFTNKSNYGTKGFIPPGIYFMHYHRLDTSIGLPRNRLGLSDAPGEETIQSTVPSPPVQRIALQFHRAFNNLAEFNAHVSEGCITLNQANFSRLFPDAIFDPAQSPLAPGAADANPVHLAGSNANILVFITDALSNGKQASQVSLFNTFKRQLKFADFGLGAGSSLPLYRVQWK